MREFAADLGRRLDVSELPPLHALVCNAGAQSAGKMSFTADGLRPRSEFQPSDPPFY